MSSHQIYNPKHQLSLGYGHAFHKHKLEFSDKAISKKRVKVNRKEKVK
jgi:hypothetical protein